MENEKITGLINKVNTLNEKARVLNKKNSEVKVRKEYLLNDIKSKLEHLKEIDPTITLNIDDKDFGIKLQTYIKAVYDKVTQEASHLEEVLTAQEQGDLNKLEQLLGISIKSKVELGELELSNEGYEDDALNLSQEQLDKAEQAHTPSRPPVQVEVPVGDKKEEPEQQTEPEPKQEQQTPPEEAEETAPVESEKQPEKEEVPSDGQETEPLFKPEVKLAEDQAPDENHGNESESIAKVNDLFKNMTGGSIEEVESKQKKVQATKKEEETKPADKKEDEQDKVDTDVEFNFGDFFGKPE